MRYQIPICSFDFCVTILLRNWLVYPGVIPYNQSIMEATEEMMKIERHIMRTASVVLYSSSKDQNELEFSLVVSFLIFVVEADFFPK